MKVYRYSSDNAYNEVNSENDAFRNDEAKSIIPTSGKISMASLSKLRNTYYIFPNRFIIKKSYSVFLPFIFRWICALLFLTVFQISLKDIIGLRYEHFSIKFIKKKKFSNTYMYYILYLLYNLWFSQCDMTHAFDSVLSLLHSSQYVK